LNLPPVFPPVYPSCSQDLRQDGKRTKEITSITGLIRSNVGRQEKSKQKLVAICSTNYANQELDADNEINTK